MMEVRSSRILRAIRLLIAVCLVSLPAHAKYGGGTGEPNEPYQIATAEDLMLLGESPEDYDKHFILTADIDLDPNLPNCKVFDRAVIAADTNDTQSGFQGTAFTGVFDGNGKKILNLNCNCANADYAGLFGSVAGKDAEIRDLGLIAPNIDAGTGEYVGSLVGWGGAITRCYVERGTIVGHEYVGGLAGKAAHMWGCYSVCSVSGDRRVGGLVGEGGEWIVNCYSTCSVSGEYRIGGLVGEQRFGSVCKCYSIGWVTGTSIYVGGLFGDGHGSWGGTCFWDKETSGQDQSDGGVGKTTTEMQDRNTFIDAGWKFLGDPNVGPSYVWAEPPGGGYPIFWWQLDPLPELPSFSGGTGEVNDPYLVANGDELNSIGHHPRLVNKHFRLIDDVDLTGIKFFRIGNEFVPFSGTFDGNGKKIKSFTWDPLEEHYDNQDDVVGLFACVEGENAVIKDVGVIDPNIGFGRYESYVGSLVGWLKKGSVTDCYLEGGSVSAYSHVGGLIGSNEGTVRQCRALATVKAERSSSGGLIGYNDGIITDSVSICDVSGRSRVGGLTGYNGAWGRIRGCRSAGHVQATNWAGGLAGVNAYFFEDDGPLAVGRIERCYSSASVASDGDYVGGLVGENGGPIANCGATGNVSGGNYVGGLVGSGRRTISNCYASGNVSGRLQWVGGLVGYNYGRIRQCYSACRVTGASDVGGLVGYGRGSVISSFWDMQSSGQVSSGGGTGKTTAEMQMASTFVDAGWDFVDEVANGTCDYWEISPADYPRLRYHMGDEPVMPEGSGTAEGPYLIRDARDLGTVWFEPHAHYRLERSLDLSGITWAMAVIRWFGGTFDGNGYVISNLRIRGVGHLGLFGELASRAKVSNLGLEAVDVNGVDYVGGIVGESYFSSMTDCYSSGTVNASSVVGGLAGRSLYGSIAGSYSSGTVSGDWDVGGLAGVNYQGHVLDCYSTAAVNGQSYVGGLLGYSEHYEGRGGVTNCYSSGAVSGAKYVGGLLGDGAAWFLRGCFWDTQTSGQAASPVGTGKTTAEMQMASTFLNAGWDFVGEMENGTQNVWAICEGVDYPHLAWEFIIGDFDADADTDLADFCILAEHWLAADGSFWCGEGCDLTSDGSVDSEDLAVFAENWLGSIAP